ncbi:hypothetical protein CR513_32782, partial [Mucuna pruriens]
MATGRIEEPVQLQLDANVVGKNSITPLYIWPKNVLEVCIDGICIDSVCRGGANTCMDSLTLSLFRV